MRRVHASSLLLLIVLLAALGWPAVARAASCSVDEASDLNFDVVGYPMVAAQTTASVTVTCSKNGNGSTKQVLVCLYIPPWFSNQRSMRRAGSQLSYGIYDNPAQGPSSTGLPLVFSHELTLEGTAPTEYTFTLYGRLAVQTVEPVPGNYADPVNALMGYDDTGGNRNCLSALGSREDFAFTSRARVVAACEVSASPLVFPDSDLDTSVQGSTSLEVRCAPGVAYRIGLNGGLHGLPGNPPVRQMEHATIGNRFVRYELYRDPARAAPWSTVASGSYVPGVGAGYKEPRTVDVYGLVPGGQGPVPVGTYEDRVTVTVEY